MSDKNYLPWWRLDNAAKIFPSTSSAHDSKVFRFFCELVEDVEPTAQRLVRTAQYLEGYRTPKPCSLTVISGPGSCGTVLNGVRVIPFDRLGA